jgi:hypothetical protein
MSPHGPARADIAISDFSSIYDYNRKKQLKHYKQHLCPDCHCNMMYALMLGAETIKMDKSVDMATGQRK